MNGTKSRTGAIAAVFFAMFLSLGLLRGVAYATTVDDVIVQVDQEYAAGHMDAATKADLNATLSDVKTAPSPEAYRAYIDTFREIVSGSSMTSEAASRLLTAANSL